MISTVNARISGNSLSCNRIFENAGMVGLQGENSLIPYHEFLMFDYNLRQRVENSTNTSISDSNKQEETNSSRSGKKYKLQCIPLAFIPPLRSETIDLM